MRKFVLIILLMASVRVFAQTVTWADNVACIVYTRCANCHNPNGIAPFSLVTYADAYTKRFDMVNSISTRHMPPWPPDKQYNSLAHEKVMTNDEIQVISAWLTAGAPEGNPANAPLTPVFNTPILITNPDLSIRIDDYTVPTITEDLYRCFILTNPSGQERFISGMEVIPGNLAAVHHVLVYQDSSAIPVNLDSADAGSGYSQFGGIGSTSAKLIGGWVPGGKANFLPDGMGIRIPGNARIVIQVHYPTTASGMLDSTRVSFQFTTNPNVRPVSISPFLNHVITMTNGPLSIPANTVKTFYERITLNTNLTLLSISPHAHHICTSMKAYAVTPVGDTIPFVKIDHWDFHWQGSYYFRQPIHVPAGTKLYGEAVYDNTVNNEHNPVNPPQDVEVGESTTDEMMLFFFSYLPYQAGDEDIVVDTITTLNTYNDCEFMTVGINKVEDMPIINVYPNPVDNILRLDIDGTNEAGFVLFDYTGREVLGGGLLSKAIDVSKLPAGFYNGVITDAKVKSVFRFIKQ